jgi:UDP-glucose 4-epimerase
MEKENQKTVLVTGGAGFIGSHLCEALLKEGKKVISLDNYSTGTKDNHVDGVEYIEGDTSEIEKLVKVKPDLVYHLGEYARVEKSFEDLEKVWQSNSFGTFKVLEFCRNHNIKIIYAGSSTKFGLPGQGDVGLGRDQSPYAWTKATNTELVRNYGAWFNLPHAITYFYNVYGERERSDATGTLVAIFREKYLKGESLPVVRPGTQRRNFTHVSDIIDGLLKVGEKGEGDEYGLGSEESYSVLEVAEMFLSAQAGGGEIKMIPERKGNRMKSDLDTSKTKKELGWEAKSKLKDYIEEIKTG